MIISQACKYSLRAIVYLAEHSEQPVLSRVIARELHIPAHFLAKILQDLSKNKLLISLKGRGGGFKLARNARAITLIEVIEAIDGPEFGRDCLLGVSECSDDTPCPLHFQWAEMRAAILARLEQTTIAHVLEQSFPSGLEITG